MAARGTPAPTYDIRDAALHVMVNAPAGTAEILAASYQFESCVDASAFSCVEFSISGSLADCPSGTEPEAVSIGLVVRDSAHVTDNGPTVRIPFDVTPTCCQPATPLDLAKLTGVGWGFFFDGSCVTDITLDDVRFY
jgi:hypothetical protein